MNIRIIFTGAEQWYMPEILLICLSGGDDSSREHLGTIRRQAIMLLQERICSQLAAVGVTGLGYVGLTEAIEFGRTHF